MSMKLDATDENMQTRTWQCVVDVTKTGAIACNTCKTSFQLETFPTNATEIFCPICRNRIGTMHLKEGMEA